MRLHISNSTIAGAAGMLAAAQRRCGYDACFFQFGDAGLERQVFSPNVIAPSKSPEWVEIFRNALRLATVVHVHNWIPEFFESIVLEELSNSDAQKVWHVHQGQFEHPVYIADDVAAAIKWDHKLAVAHGFARTFDDFTPVPNCVFRDISSELARTTIESRPRESAALRVIFSPSSRTGTRWGKKTDEKFDATVDTLKTLKGLHVQVSTGEAPQSLLLLRCAFDVTIDEVLTGAFHLVSYEGMFAGNVVLNGADDLSLALFCEAIDAAEPPPFVRCTPGTLIETALHLRDDLAHRQRIQRQSREYFEKYLGFERIVKKFESIYTGKV